jgi:hypothetical protein
MKNIRKPNGYWTFDKVKEEAVKYNNSKEFKLNSYSAYSTAVSKKWLKDITSHFILLGNSYSRFVYAIEFSDNHSYIGLTYDVEKRKKEHLRDGRVFNHVEKTGIYPIFIQLTEVPVTKEQSKELEQFYLDEYISKGWNILNSKKAGALGGNNVKWTFEKLKEEALKYTTKKEFRDSNSSAYSTAKKQKILGIICSHMIFKERKPAGYWSYSTCKEESAKYSTRTEYAKKSVGSYEVARKNRWLDEFYSINKC